MRSAGAMGRLGTALVAALLVASSVAAQVCGDADENGTVSVSDGVQALRAAAGLPSICGSACDVDDSGTISVTDGVDILRAVAGLPVTESCDFTSEDTNDVVSPSLSIFDGMTKIPGFVTSGASAAASTAPPPPTCENSDGTVVVDQSVVTFTNCQLNKVILDGQVGRLLLSDRTVVAFDNYKITRIKNGRSLTYNGTVPLVDEADGKRLTGALNVVSSEHGPGRLEFTRILLVGDGSVQQGSLLFDLTKSTTPHIATIMIDFSNADELPVTVTLRNGQVLRFTLDRPSRTVLFPL